MPGDQPRAGKSPSQIFAGAATACHKSRAVFSRPCPASSLPASCASTTPQATPSLGAVVPPGINGATDTVIGRSRARKAGQGRQTGAQAKLAALPVGGSPVSRPAISSGRPRRHRSRKPEVEPAAERTPMRKLTPQERGSRAGFLLCKAGGTSRERSDAATDSEIRLQAKETSAARAARTARSRS